MEPNGIDKDTHSLRAVVSVRLKEWYEDTEMKLLAKIGENEISLPMISDGNGSYSSQLALPIEGNHEISLDALITGSGLTRRESLQTWGDISALKRWTWGEHHSIHYNWAFNLDSKMESNFRQMQSLHRMEGSQTVPEPTLCSQGTEGRDSIVRNP